MFLAGSEAVWEQDLTDYYKGVPANQLMVPYPLNIEMIHCTGLNKLQMTDHGLA